MCIKIYRVGYAMCKGMVAVQVDLYYMCTFQFSSSYANIIVAGI